MPFVSPHPLRHIVAKDKILVPRNAALLLVLIAHGFVLEESKIFDLAFRRYAIGVAPLPMPFWESEKLRMGFRILDFDPEHLRRGEWNLFISSSENSDWAEQL